MWWQEHKALLDRKAQLVRLDQQEHKALLDRKARQVFLHQHFLRFCQYHPRYQW
jgi:hypothetical protein